MYQRRHPSANWLAWFALTGCGLGLTLGCNPSLAGNLSGSSTVALDPPNGYVIILLINQTTASVLTDVQIAKQNGANKIWTMTSGPAAFYTLAQDCDITTVQFLDFGSSSASGINTVASNLGTLTMGQEIYCGNVIAVTATGTPPTFSVQVY